MVSWGGIVNNINIDIEVANKINNTRANPPEVAGNPRKEYKTPPKDWTKLSQSELRESWDDIVKDAVERSKATVKTSR
mgnify:CR=1 FL=1